MDSRNLSFDLSGIALVPKLFWRMIPPEFYPVFKMSSTEGSGPQAMYFNANEAYSGIV